MAKKPNQIPLRTLNNMVLGKDGLFLEKKYKSLTEIAFGAPLLYDLEKLRESREICGISASTFLLLSDMMEYKHGQIGRLILAINRPHRMREFISPFYLKSYEEANATLARLLSDSDYFDQVLEEYGRHINAEKKDRSGSNFWEHLSFFIAALVIVFAIAIIIVATT